MSTDTSTVTVRPRRRPFVPPALPPTPTAPDTASFTGEVPSALASEAESGKAEARASASAAASAFETSVSAGAERARAEAEQQLKNVDGRGNATGDVSMTGLPLNETNGVRALNRRHHQPHRRDRLVRRPGRLQRRGRQGGRDPVRRSPGPRTGQAGAPARHQQEAPGAAADRRDRQGAEVLTPRRRHHRPVLRSTPRRARVRTPMTISATPSACGSTHQPVRTSSR